MSGRVVFITILTMGILVNGMWKAVLTSALAVEKNGLKYQGLEDLLVAGILPIIQKSSASEEIFRSAKTGSFKKAWEKMVNNKKAFWTNSSDGLARIIKDNTLALLGQPILLENTKEYISCQLDILPRVNGLCLSRRILSFMNFLISIY